MRIGILSFWQSYDNYGQILQCWALQEALRDLGQTPYHIRYNFQNRKIVRNPIKTILKLLVVYPYIKQIIHDKRRFSILNNNRQRNSIREFDFFRKEYLKFSEYEYNNLKEIQKNPPLADMYIVGSDQVWAQLLNYKENSIFFLNFGDKNTRRISYAASFAIEHYPPKILNLLKQHLSRFDAISVRESGGVSICSQCGFKSILVCDPTLLFDKYKYMKMPINKKSGNYIFIYSLNVSNPSDINWEELKKMAFSKSLNIKVTPASGYIDGKELFGNEVEYEYATIQNWLSLINDSKMVVTPSYHGIIFSILFNRKFVYVPLDNCFKTGNNRVLSLLSYLNLENRVLSNSNYDTLFESDIDWENVNKKLDVLRNKSLKFLKDEMQS